MSRINVLTANIHMGFSMSNRRFVLPELREAIRSVSADIVFLQEVLGEHSGHSRRHAAWPDVPHYEFLADSLWPQFAYGQNAVYPHGHHGNALLSKFPIVRHRNRDVSVAGHENRGLLHCVLDMEGRGGRELHTLCVHLGLRDAHRRRQIDLLCRVVHNDIPHDAPLVVAGDFNDWRGRGHAQIERCGLREVFMSVQGRLARTFPALVGGGGLRYRLYTRYGIRGGSIVRIIAFSIVTNWSGYLLLAGGVFVFGLLVLPEDFAVGSTSPRILGALMLVAVVGYLLLCAFGHDRTWKLRGTAFAPPSLPLAGVQLALSSANWLAIAAILFILLEQRVDYPSLLGVVLLGAVAAAMTHIPAGLGALEAVFVVLLGSRIAQADLLAALLAYRALYYLAPLLVAVVVYVVFESRGRRRG